MYKTLAPMCKGIYTYPWTFITLLFWVCEILQDSKLPKQASINAFLFMSCKGFWAGTLWLRMPDKGNSHPLSPTYPLRRQSYNISFNLANFMNHRCPYNTLPVPCPYLYEQSMTIRRSRPFPSRLNNGKKVTFMSLFHSPYSSVLFTNNQ